ncbi:MAG: Uma2 family endonuclease [Acidimicrobiales bacterium]
MSSVATFPSNLTWDEFLALPYETRNAALVDGEVWVNPPNAQHELVVRNLNIMFVQWMRAGAGRGDVSTQQPVKISDRRGYQPDFMWYPPELCAPPDEPASFSGPPSLLVEVLSPSTRSFDLIRKRADYEHVGIAEVWFVDPPERKVMVCQRSEPGALYGDTELGAGDTISSPLLEGFELPVDDLFRR